MGVDASLWPLGGYAAASLVLQAVACFTVARVYWGRGRLRNELTRGQLSEHVHTAPVPRWPKFLSMVPLPVPAIVGGMLGHPRDWIRQGYYERLRVFQLAADIMVEGIVVSAIIVGVLALHGHRARSSTPDGIAPLSRTTVQTEHWLVAISLAALPFLIGVHLFAGQITNSLADGPIFGTKRLDAWMATNAASEVLLIAGWLSILCLVVLTTVAMALVRKSTGTARGWTRAAYPALSLLTLGGAAFIVTRGAPLAAENSSPWPAPSLATAYDFHGAPPPLAHLGRCPDILLSATTIELRSGQEGLDATASMKMRVYGWTARDNLSLLGDDLFAEATTMGLLAYERPHLLNVFAEPVIPTAELAQVLARAQQAGFLQLALACGEEESVDRPLFGMRSRILASTIRLTLTQTNRETSQAFHTGAYRTIGELASRVLEAPDPGKEHFLVIDESRSQ